MSITTDIYEGEIHWISDARIELRIKRSQTINLYSRGPAHLLGFTVGDIIRASCTRIHISAKKSYLRLVNRPTLLTAASAGKTVNLKAHKGVVSWIDYPTNNRPGLLELDTTKLIFNFTKYARRNQGQNPLPILGDTVHISTRGNGPIAKEVVSITNYGQSPSAGTPLTTATNAGIVAAEKEIADRWAGEHLPSFIPPTNEEAHYCPRDNESLTKSDKGDYLVCWKCGYREE